MFFGSKGTCVFEGWIWERFSLASFQHTHFVSKWVGCSRWPKSFKNSILFTPKLKNFHHYKRFFWSKNAFLKNYYWKSVMFFEKNSQKVKKKLFLAFGNGRNRSKILYFLPPNWKIFTTIRYFFGPKTQFCKIIIGNQ